MSSIEATYLSNHTLHELIVNIRSPFRGDWINQFMREDVEAYLTMNENDDKSMVARQKIIKHYFSRGRTDIRLFACMPENKLPTAIGWIGRDELGFSLMYELIQSLPGFFDSRNLLQAATKKRRL